MRKPTVTTIIGLAATLTFVIEPWAHDPESPFSDLEIQIDATNSLVTKYPIASTPVVTVTDTGFAGLWSGAYPGFVAGEAEPGVSAPPLGTTVGVELLAIDENVQFRLNGTTLDAPGETEIVGTHDDADRANSDLHRHGEYQLFVDAGSGRAFAEGLVSMRVFDDAGVFAASRALTLTVSNGYLPDIVDPSKATNKCRKKLAKEVGKFVLATYSTLAKCIDAADAIANLGKPAAPAPKICGLDPGNPKGMIGKIEAARGRAISKIDAACGPLSTTSLPFTQSAVEAHIDMARCRGEEMAGATYNNARDLIEDALEAAIGGSACVADSCVGGEADGDACATDEDCATETLVFAQTLCMDETVLPE